MSKNKRKAITIDVTEIENKSGDTIIINSPLVGSQGFDNSDPNSYVQMKDIEGGIPGVVSDLQEVTDKGAQTNNVIMVSGNQVPNTFTGKGVYISANDIRGIIESFDFDNDEGRVLVINPDGGRVVLGGTIDDETNSFQTEAGIRSNGFLSGMDGFRAGGNNLSYGMFAVSGNYTQAMLHAFDDYSVATAIGNGQGYSSFDASRTLRGGFDQDHMISFQARHNYEGTGAITGVYGITGFFNHTTHNGTGTVSAHQGVWIDDISGDGEVLKSIGVFIQPITRGSEKNYAIYTNQGKVRFGDNVDAPEIQGRFIIATENENKFNTQKTVFMAVQSGIGKINSYDFVNSEPIPLILNDLGGATQVPTAPVSPTDVVRLQDLSDGTGLKVKLLYNEADVNSSGEVVIRSGDASKLAGKSLLSAYVGLDYIPGSYLDRNTTTVTGFGGYIGATGLTIELTFI